MSKDITSIKKKKKVYLFSASLVPEESKENLDSNRHTSKSNIPLTLCSSSYGAFEYLVNQLTEKECMNLKNNCQNKENPVKIYFTVYKYKKKDLKGIIKFDNSIFSTELFSIPADIAYTSEVKQYILQEFNFEINPDTSLKNITFFKLKYNNKD
jgi:hypothetical protein